MGVINPVQGVADQFSGGMKLIQPPEPLPIPVTRSFLFEIINTKTNMVEESFALVVPPEAVSVREGQRVSVTKTFGNIFVDDYGPDNIQIMIKGFSGTAHPFPTYQPANRNANVATAQGITSEAQISAKAASVGYVHKTAFYQFRDSIIRYKYKYKDRYGDMKLRVYDLYDQQSYDCILMDFSCERDARRPLYYPYSITLLVYNLPDVTGNVVPEAIPMGGIIDVIIDAINTGMNYINAGFSFINGVSGSINIIQNSLSVLSSQMSTLINQAGSAALVPLQSVKTLITGLGSFSTVINTAYTQGKITKAAWLNARETIQDAWRQTMKLYTEAISQGQQKTRTEYMQIDRGLQISNEITTGMNPDVSKNSRDADVQSFSFTGFSLYTVKGQDSLQSIAQEKLGDSNLWPYIAKINSIVNNTELHTKTQIYVPSKTSTNKDAFIITEHAEHDPYGTDIRLDKDGDFMISGNDFVLISGSSNVQQWINMMFQTPQGSVLKHTVLGLAGIIGAPGDSMAYSYLASSIRATLNQDPRIKSVTNITADINKDVVVIGMNILLVGYDSTIPVSVTL